MSFTPNAVHINQGDQGIVQCVVEFYQNNPPQTFMYVNDCKMMGFDHPTWITRIMQTDGPCSHTDSSRLCRTLTMYINGTAEAHSSRVYCCARLGGRVCSPNSTVSVVEAPQPTPTDFAGLCPTTEPYAIVTYLFAPKLKIGGCVKSCRMFEFKALRQFQPISGILLQPQCMLWARGIDIFCMPLNLHCLLSL